MSSSSTLLDYDADSDVESDSSSVIYTNEEPFVTFSPRVLDFALHKIWPNAKADEITVERMVGGGYNRIIGLSRRSTQQSDAAVRYVLRIPRYSDEPLDNQISVLRFLRQHCAISVPDVISFDETDDNELNTKYMIQNRVPGTNLASSYADLTHEQKCRVAWELGHIYSELLHTISSEAAILVPPREDTTPLKSPLLSPACFPPTETFESFPGPPNIRKMLIDIFMDQKASELKTRPNSMLRPYFLDQFCDMTSWLAEKGWFTDCYISLAHLDLEPRNILANPASDIDQPIISAILDWDSAVFAPQFMCCKPPLWIWTWNNDEDDDESRANEEPLTWESHQLKRLFEHAAGSDYARFAYSPIYRLARRLVRFAIDSIYSNEDYKEAEEMLEEWESIKNNQDKVPPIEQISFATRMKNDLDRLNRSGPVKATESSITIQDYNSTAWNVQDITTWQNESSTTWNDVSLLI